MTKKTVHVRKTRTKRSAEKPVSEGIKLAAARAGIAPAGELAALRELADCAESMFEGEGVANKTPAKILSEALICARTDIDLLMDSALSGLGADDMAFVRAKRRIDLALKLASYRDRFGRVAAGGAS